MLEVDAERDKEYEARFRTGFFTPTEGERVLLRLLDAERARADAAEAKVARVEWCNFVSPSSEDGYCACVKPKHPNTEYHACQHGAMV